MDTPTTTPLLRAIQAKHPDYTPEPWVASRLGQMRAGGGSTATVIARARPQSTDRPNLADLIRSKYPAYKPEPWVADAIERLRAQI